MEESPEFSHPIEMKSAKTVSGDYFKGLKYWEKLSDEMDNGEEYIRYLMTTEGCDRLSQTHY